MARSRFIGHWRSSPKGGRSGAFPTPEETQRRYDLQSVVKTPRAKARALVLGGLLLGFSTGLHWREYRRALKELHRAGLVKFGRTKSRVRHRLDTVRATEGAFRSTRPLAKSARKERRPWR